MNKEEQLLASVRDLYQKMSWLNGAMMKVERFQGYKSSEIHCLEAIAENPDPNVTKLAEVFYMTRGAISKLTKKLIEKGAITSYQKPENKKEVYFRLTEQGEAIYRLHQDLHRQFQERDRLVFEQVSDEQFATMLDFVERYRNHLDREIKKLGLDLRQE